MSSIEKRIENLEAETDLAPLYLFFSTEADLEAWHAQNPDDGRTRYLIVTGVPHEMPLPTDRGYSALPLQAQACPTRRKQ